MLSITIEITPANFAYSLILKLYDKTRYPIKDVYLISDGLESIGKLIVYNSHDSAARPVLSCVN